MPRQVFERVLRLPRQVVRVRTKDFRRLVHLLTDSPSGTGRLGEIPDDAQPSALVTRSGAARSVEPITMDGAFQCLTAR